MKTIEKSVSIKEQTKDTRGLAFALYGRGKVYLYLKEFEKAQTDLSNALQLQIKMGDKLGVSMAYNKMGLLFYELKDYSEAKKYLGMTLEFAAQYDIQVIQSKAYYHLHLVAKAEGNAVEALQYLESYNKIKEGFINTQTFNVIKSYEAKSKIEALEREAQSQRDKTDIIEKKNAELDSFFYRVSHDLKGPISSLLGLHNLIKMEVKDEHARRYFDMYQSQIMRINNVVMDLIELTRMNHTQDSKVRINFRASLDDCINAYHYLDNFKYIIFIKEIDETIEFYSEWAIVNTILQNLIENAIKYARIDREPFIRVAISRENDDFIKIIVEDNGIGIRDDFKSKVFNMFFRANDRVQGTGLGLYILKRAVERLKGEVTFESDVKTGSVFSILLPLVQT
jgi:signal transduction histidine kinase